jgi:two-component system, OmpR family, sensor kinase
MRLRHFVRARLHRQLFAWLGITILVTGLISAAVVSALRPSSDGFQENLVRVEDFVGQRFAQVWDMPAERRELARGFSQAFRLDLTLTNAKHAALESVGRACVNGQFTVAVERAGTRLGYIEVCMRGRRLPTGAFAAALGAACLTLWLASGFLAHRLLRPLSDLIRVTREIGSGNLASRVRLGRRYAGEVGVLADSVNDMARRIERQLHDQRELLAAVSHEIRSPLARLRVLVELLRDPRANSNLETLAKVEREVIEIDDLVGKLLASSRLDFEALSRTPLDLPALVQRALERAGIDAALLHAPAECPKLFADATLLERALGNLFENGQKHGGGVSGVEITLHGPALRITVSDRGPGFPKAALERAFEAFYRGDSSASLGLGLSLVQRIARAHGGKAWAENRADGGASVSLEMPSGKPGSA